MADHNARECWCGVDHDLERRIVEARYEYEEADKVSSMSALTAYKLGLLTGLESAKITSVSVPAAREP